MTVATRTCVELGEIAAQHFDVVVVREDVALRRRPKGETAGFVADGVRAAMEAGCALQAARGRSSTRSTPYGTR